MAQKIETPPGCGPIQEIDKAELRRIMAAVNARMGVVPDPTATAEQARAMMRAEGIRPEENAFSRELIKMRDEKIGPISGEDKEE